MPQPNAWGTLLQRKAGFLYVAVQLCRPIKSLMLRGGLISHYCSLNRYVLVQCRISMCLSRAGGVDTRSVSGVLIFIVINWCPVQVAGIILDSGQLWFWLWLYAWYHWRVSLLLFCHWYGVFSAGKSWLRLGLQVTLTPEAYFLSKYFFSFSLNLWKALRSAGTSSHENFIPAIVCPGGGQHS